MQLACFIPIQELVAFLSPPGVFCRVYEVNKLTPSPSIPSPFQCHFQLPPKVRCRLPSTAACTSQEALLQLWHCCPSALPSDQCAPCPQLGSEARHLLRVTRRDCDSGILGPAGGPLLVQHLHVSILPTSPAQPQLHLPPTENPAVLFPCH